jgi:hypothetical protein
LVNAGTKIPFWPDKSPISAAIDAERVDIPCDIFRFILRESGESHFLRPETCTSIRDAYDALLGTAIGTLTAFSCPSFCQPPCFAAIIPSQKVPHGKLFPVPTLGHFKKCQHFWQSCPARRNLVGMSENHLGSRISSQNDQWAVIFWPAIK